MIGADGRVRVLDFGLARFGEAEEPRAGEIDVAAERPDRGLTLTGTLLGTPAYMAPEQLTRRSADARSDQFTFCVTLFEALHGYRPFAGETVDTLAEAIIAGRIAARPKDTRVPQWVHSAVLRGLQVDPAKRWPSMHALLAALERDPRVRARRIGVAVALVAGIGALAGGVEGYRRWDVARRVAACEAEGAVIDETWNDDTRRRVRDAFMATGVSYAAASAEHAMPWLTAQADGWKQARTETCLDGQVRGTWDADTVDLSSWCLDERRIELEALVTEMAQANKATVQRAVVAAASLGRLGPCRDADWLRRSPPLPEDREGARAVLALVSRVDALGPGRGYKDALDAAQEALTAAEALGSPSLAAAARLRKGIMLGRSGQPGEAEAVLESAYFQAVRVGALQVGADAAIKLMFNVGYQQARHEDGKRWSRHADVLLAALGIGDEDFLRASFLNDLAAVHDSAGAYAEARALHEQALAISERALGPDHPLVGISLANLSVVHDEMGAYEEAKALGKRALAVRERAFGPDHPTVADSLDNLATVHKATGNYEEAKALERRALAIREKSLGPDHPAVASSLHNLGSIYTATGDYADARPLYERALAIATKAMGPDHLFVAQCLDSLAGLHSATGAHREARDLSAQVLAIREKKLGPDHPDVGHSLVNLGGGYNSLGAHEEAKALFGRALAVLEKSLGPDHKDVAESLINLAVVHALTGAYAEARPLAERALAIFEKAVGPDHPMVAHPVHLIAEIALAQGRPADAVAPAVRGLRIREAVQGPAELVADSRFVLAQALWQAPAGSGRDRDRARLLAQQAIDGYGAVDRRDKQRDVTDFLKKHRAAQR